MEMNSVSKSMVSSIVIRAFRLLQDEMNKELIILSLWNSDTETLKLASDELTKLSLAEEYIKQLIWYEADKLSKDFSE